VFGLDPVRDEVAVKSRLTYVADAIAFYPWMSVRQVLDYFAAFRTRWNITIERTLLDQFRLDECQKAMTLSKGQRTQLGLIVAICPEPEMLVLDEPTSGLDPIVRREFIRTVIGAYQEGDPRRTVFVSTHLISEFEGLIDRFTVIDGGRNVLTLDADEARQRYQKIYARFASTPPPSVDITGARVLRRLERELELVANGNSDELIERLRAYSPDTLTVEALTLEDVFVTTVHAAGAAA
jgi:ABC-2 type transport system ATP-binding protein